MIRSSRGGLATRRILIAAAAALVPMIAGCEAGLHAPSLQWHQPTDGTSYSRGGITIINAFVLGAPLGHVLRPGQNAGLFLGLASTAAPDRLVSIAAPGVARYVTLPAGPVLLNGQHVVLLTGPRPTVVLRDLIRPVTGGSVVTIRLMFARAGLVTMKVPVMPAAQYYATFFPAPAPAPTGTRTPVPSPSASGAPVPSVSPSPSRTP